MPQEKLSILIVDDDVVIGPVLVDYLESKDYNAFLVQDSLKALEKVKEQAFDLCILDVKMPGKSGFELAIELARLFPSLPFLFLTGEADKSKKIEGLQIGADDYITKPFNIEELLLRIKIITRRTKRLEEERVEPEEYVLSDYVFRDQQRELVIGDYVQKLSAIENQLLLLFCTSPNNIIDRDTALKQIWNDDYMLKTRSLNVYIGKLRGYLKRDERIEILNMHGKGYHLIIK